MKLVLDAWAILAYLQREEPAASQVRAILKEAATDQAALFVSLVNVGEVFYRIGKRQGEKAAEETLQELQHLPLSIVSPKPETIMKAARLKIHYSLSYADAFAVVTAQEFHGTLLTGDPELLQLKGIVAMKKLSRH